MTEPVFDANGWATIDSAPSSTDQVWVWDRMFGEASVQLADGGWWRYRGDECRYSHWRPLKPPHGPVGT